MSECKTCKHERDICSLVSHCQGVCDRWEPKPVTNYDRLVSKSPEELAEWLAEVLFHCSNTICDKKCPMYKCCCDQPSNNIEDWLKQEAEE